MAHDPDDVNAVFSAGIACARLRRYREATQYWEQVLALDHRGSLAGEARRHIRTARDLSHVFRLQEA